MIDRGSVLFIMCFAHLNTHFKVNALPFFGSDDNCILSFVVPKENMKSSCELDEKVNRRINAMETKVNIYKQQVSDVLTQLDKQRQLNSDKLAKMEQQVKDISVNVDMGFLIERRLALLEKEFQQMQSDLSSAKSAGGKTKSVASDDKSVSLFLNTVDNNSVTLSSMAKSLIQSEMKSFFDNFNKKIETYVQEQVVLYNKVFNMLPKRMEVLDNNGQTSGSSISSTEKEIKADPGLHKPDLRYETVAETAEDKNDKKSDISNQTDKTTSLYFENATNIEYNMNITDENINITHEYFNITGDYINITNTHSNITDEWQDLNGTIAVDYGDFVLVNNSDNVFIDDLFETNDSFVGDVSEDNNTSHKESVTSSDTDISKSATSRINSKHQAAAGSRHQENSDSDSDKSWKEDMIRDQSHKLTELQDRIKEEITSMLLPPLAEVMSLIEKQKLSLDEKLKHQDEKYEQVNTELTTHVKELDGNVHSITLQIESLSKGFQDSFSKLDKIQSLETLINDLRKNITAEPLTVSAVELSEQSKKLKMLERLMPVFQQSLEHYRNETKHEYREMKNSIDKDTTAFRMFTKTLQSNLTTTLNSEIGKQSNIFSNKIQKITDQLEMQDEQLVLLQLDLGNVEKTLNSRATRWSDRDVDKLQDEMNQMAIKQRDFKKKLDYLQQGQANLTENLNLTATEVSSLKLEVKLNLDEWIPWNFEFDSSRTDCFGDQYVRRTKYSKAPLVGVVLCSPKRYKIFLSPSLHKKFLNIGDGNGMGEDHCEFIGGTNGAQVTLSPFKTSFGTVQGYSRNHWGENPAASFLNVIKPSPHWYECNVEIP